MRYTVLATAFAFFLVGFALIAPDLSYAQAGGLVPCNGPECNICHLTQLAQRFIEFIVRITFIAAALLFAYAGFLFFTGGTSPERITNARKIFTNTFVGIIIVLTSWLVVDVILKTLVGQGVNPFTSILCDIRSPSSTQTTTQTSNTNQNLNVTGGQETIPKPQDTYRWSAIAEVTYTSGAKGRTTVNAGPFTSQAQCFESLRDPSKFVPNTTEVLFVSFFTDCSTSIPR